MDFKQPVIFLTALVMLCSCYKQADRSQAVASKQKMNLVPLKLHAADRLVAIGDLHGDLQATVKAFQMAGAVDEKGRWIGGSLIVVQTGDQLDRGDDEKAILDFLAKLQSEAEKAGGALHILNGNHELMNAALDFRYVTEKGFRDFSVADTSFVPAQIPDFAKPRAASFIPGGEYALKLAARNTIQIIGETVFVHGGILPEHVSYGLDKINNDYSNWLSGKIPDLPAILKTDSSPVWTRRFSDETPESDCKLLDETLKAVPARRMVIAHTVFDKINSECDGRLWRIDVGMSHYYGGTPAVLEIINDNDVRIISSS